ncbi:hypothetical protein ACJRO7_033960 [Eucalyptus globulus]|uniref:FAD-binding domain-containing protein n=1 Tax=Eucalyptus globulus TaxID=34317 RepID=A0ABD3J257_EUCGL
MEEVVIVGAGIAGLATAVALKKVGVRALILERSNELRATGTALGLFANAWVALDTLGVSDKLAALCSPLERGYITDVRTKSIQEVHYRPSSRNGALPRAVHRKVLLEVLAEELPPNSIRFSSRITSIETQVEHGLSICIVTLDNGTIIKSKVVIGCDGIHSIVARWLGLRPPVSSGRLGVRGLSVFPKGHGFDHSDALQQFVDVGRRAAFFTLNDKEVYWFFGATCPKDMEKEADPEMIQREVMEDLAKDFPPLFLDIVKHSDLSSLTWAPLMFRYPWDILLGNLARSNITVAGDAMHPMTPDLGQGGCSALEDAVVLGRHLGDSISKHGKLETQYIGLAIGRYAKERRLRAATLVTASYLSGWLQEDGSSRIMRFLRVVFYGLLLARVVNGITEHDCGKLPSVSSLPSCESESSI